MKDKYILLDSSLGNVDPPINPKFMTEVRKRQDLRKLLEVLGISPDDVSMVIHSHMHRDHTGWNVVHGEDGKLIHTFKNAKHYIQKKEWDYWTSNEKNLKSVNFDICFEPIKDKIVLLDGDT